MNLGMPIWMGATPISVTNTSVLRSPEQALCVGMEWEGVPSSSGIPIGELVTQEGLQEPFAKDSTHTGHLRTADPIPTHWQAESGGSHKRPGWQKWLRSVACTRQPASRGHLAHPRLEGGKKPPWGQQKATAGGREPCKGGGPGKGRWSHLTVGFHCTHVITHTLC